jgi:diguanylate cyclase (GGDEF)-like protein/putative nucleotidyltransferase with HDIG domain
MQFFLRRLKITTQLILGFSTIILCMGSVSAIDTAASVQQSAIAYNLVNHLYPARINVNEIVTLINGLDDDGAWYVLSHDPIQQEELLQSYEQKVKELQGVLSQAIKLSDTLEQRQAIIEVQHFFFDKGAYYDNAHNTFALKRAGQEKKAYKNYTASPFAPQIQLYANIYIHIVEREIVQQTLLEQTYVNIARALDLVLAVLAVLLGGGIAIIVTRSISSLYRELEEKNALQVETNVELEALAATDALTKLPNHGAIVTILANELERAKRSKRPCSLLFLDLDHFKALNDSYGHSAGDTVLCKFGGLIRTSLRSMDTVGRWGGEEFVVILPETGENEAMVVAERIREMVSEYSFTVGGGLHLTCSIGLACYPDQADNEELLLNAADQAMYGAKHLGRNQVRTINDPAIQALFTGEVVEGGREEITLLGTVGALSSLLGKRDPSLEQHSQQVATLAGEIALVMNMTEAEARVIALAGKLHDIGKVAIPDAILQKSEKLVDKEMIHMRSHPIVGSEVINHIPSLRPLVPIIRAHHEQWDGNGYPDRLAGEQIPLAARIVAVADTYSKMQMALPHQQSYTSAVALQKIQQSVGTQFDARVVEALIHLVQGKSEQLQSEQPQNESVLVKA